MILSTWREKEVFLVENAQHIWKVKLQVMEISKL